jgi:hypothetical protein
MRASARLRQSVLAAQPRRSGGSRQERSPLLSDDYQTMSALDTLAEKAQAASKRLAGQNGIKGKLAAELAEDAVFLRKLKPSLIAKRVKGDAPTNLEPAEASRRSRSLPSPFLLVGAAAVAGGALAKWIDWRGHAHPHG